jgi:hypothetical protein
MKRLVLCVAVCFVLMFAVSAWAQNASMAAPQQKSEAASTLGSIVGRYVSIYSDSNTLTNVPAYPTLTTVASTTVPASYRSKTQWLIVQVTMQEYCVSDSLATVVYADGLAMYPDNDSSFFWECQNNGGYETRTRTWVFPPEKLGGPPIPKVISTVDVVATSSAGTASVNLRSVIVQAVK